MLQGLVKIHDLLKVRAYATFDKGSSNITSTHELFLYWLVMHFNGLKPGNVIICVKNIYRGKAMVCQYQID